MSDILCWATLLNLGRVSVTTLRQVVLESNAVCCFAWFGEAVGRMNHVLVIVEKLDRVAGVLAVSAISSSRILLVASPPTSSMWSGKSSMTRPSGGTPSGAAWCYSVSSDSSASTRREESMRASTFSSNSSSESSPEAYRCLSVSSGSSSLASFLLSASSTRR